MRAARLLPRKLVKPARTLTALLLLALGGAGAITIPGPGARAATVDGWPTSLHDVSRDGASADTVISTATAPYLTKRWSYQAGGPIASQPTIVGGVAYVGSWDGYEYAFNAGTGAVLWKTYLGITHGYASCNPPSAGVSSAATVQNGTVYVGGGDNYWYALDATTGAVLWKVYTGDSSAAGGNYNWASPLIVGNYAYIGVSSLGDCPLVQGKLIKADLTTHQVVATLNLVPTGQVGGGIWTSPPYSPALKEIFTVTGTETSAAQTYAQAVIGIDAASLTVKDYWHLPESQAVPDSDWTTSTGLYTASNGVPMFVATNKNGITYAFRQDNIAAGPVWSHQTAIGNPCPVCGYSTVSSAAIAGNVVYQAGGVTTIGGTGYGGSVQAVDATTGQTLWQHPEAGPVIGAISYANGMVIAAAGGVLELLDATTGQRLYSYTTNPAAWVYAAPAISSGIIMTGNTAGVIYAFQLPATLPSPPPPDPNCPAGYTCQSIGGATGTDSVTSGTWTVTAAGTGVSGTSDQFRLISQPSAGDTQVSVQVSSLTGGTSGGAAAGVILRQDNSPGSPFYAVQATPTSIVVSYRKVFGANPVVATTIALPSLPVYLEIQRRADVLQAATSADGTTFTLIPGSTATVVMPYASLGGLAVSSGSSNGAAATAVAAGFQVGAPSNTPQPYPSNAGCLAGWSCVDVGNPVTSGQQTWSGGTLTLAGAGTAFGNGSMTDQFHYAYQPQPGDFTASALISSQANTNPGAVAGLMARAGTDSSAAFYGIFLTPGNGIEVMDRTGPGLPAQVVTTLNGVAPAYLQITRSATTLSAYTSPDGVNWFPVIGGTTSIPALAGTVNAGEVASSAVPATLGTVTFNAVSSTASAPPPPTTCPANWLCTDIAAPIPPGSNYQLNDRWALLAGGTDIWGTTDELHYTAQQLAGDGTISTQIVSQQNTDPWAKAGIMLRASASPTAPYFAVLSTGGNGTVVQYRMTDGGSTSQVSGVTSGAPIFVRVTRAGTTYTAYTSADGSTWTAFPGGSISIPALSGTIYAGMAATSHSQFITGTTVFSNFTITTASSTLLFPWSDQDVGSPALAGSAQYANGVYTVSGGGADIWNTTGQFNYVSQSITGNFSVTTRVTSQTNTDQWAKAGILIRQSTASGSSYALLAVTPAHGVIFQYGNNTSISGGGYTFPNAWLRLTRSGSVLTAYDSADGVTWTQIGSATLAFTDPVMTGLAVVSHNTGQISTVTFDNVAVTPPPGLPAPWSDSDVGSPAVAGAASYANGVFTVSGSGADIWNSTQQFHFVSQSLSGNFTITARVTSQSNTDPWAKAGLIIYQSLTGAGPYALLAVAPGNGIAFQYGNNTSVSGGAYTFPNAWLRLTRSGTTITAYVSADGTTWTTIATATVSFTDPVLIGLAQCSHSASVLGTATFDNVAVTATAAAAIPAPLHGPLPARPVLAPGAVP